MNYSTIQAYLHDLSNKQGLVDLAIKGCGDCIDNQLKENEQTVLGGYVKEELKLAFNHQELVFKDYIRPDIIIQTQIGIYIDDPKGIWLRNLQPVGRYILETNEQGEPVDDWLLMEEEKNGEFNSISHLRSLNALVPEMGLRQNSPYYQYLSDVHHAMALYQSQHYAASAGFIVRAFEYLDQNSYVYEREAYFKTSRQTLKILLNHLVNKKLLSEVLIKELQERGMVKK
jgi:hypothetical protein